jgi:hypothetical protein
MPFVLTCRSSRQWGNLLVLAAALNDPLLRHHTNRSTVKYLFQRTIAFFKQLTQPTSALLTDMRILEHLERDLFGNDSRANSSFSSSTSMVAPTHSIPQSIPPNMAYAVNEAPHAPSPQMQM